MKDDLDVMEMKLDERNELQFLVRVAGSDSPPNAYRLVCEDGEISYCFNGELVEGSDGVVRFSVPSMNAKLKPNVVYNSAIEVLVENRYFRPVVFGVKFKETVKVVAESLKVSSSSSVSVTAEKPRLSEKKETAPTLTFSITPVKLPKKTIQERAAEKKSLTGIDDKTMEEVAKSTMAKLSAMDSPGRQRR